MLQFSHLFAQLQEEVASLLRRVWVCTALALYAAYVHSYDIPVFMYHLCGTPVEKSRTFDQRRCIVVASFSRMAQTASLLAPVEHDIFHIF